MHISELAQRHVDLPEQVVTVDQDVFVKVIDIDLERRRISLSLKQANEGVDPEGDDTTFDPALYGMAAEYDDNGEYKYPEGFDPETNEWLEGYDAQREEWEGQYAAAYERWTAHKAQVIEAIKADEESANAPGRRVHHLLLDGVRSPGCAVLLPVDLHGRGHPGLRRGPGRPARQAHRQLILGSFRGTARSPGPAARGPGRFPSADGP